MHTKICSFYNLQNPPPSLFHSYPLYYSPLNIYFLIFPFFILSIFLFYVGIYISICLSFFMYCIPLQHLGLYCCDEYQHQRKNSNRGGPQRGRSHQVGWWVRLVRSASQVGWRGRLVSLAGEVGWSVRLVRLASQVGWRGWLLREAGQIGWSRRLAG